MTFQHMNNILFMVDDLRSTITMLRIPDGHGRIELH
jgi:hypothetical protein